MNVPLFARSASSSILAGILTRLLAAASIAIGSVTAYAGDPSVQVIGLGAQGTQIFDMLAMGTTMNGVVYHPYHFASCIPETVYEWEWLDYGSWIAAIDAKTKLPKWETEWGIGTTAAFTNTHQANFIARRLLQAAGLGVEHTFVYEFMDNGSEHYGVDSFAPLTPKPAFYAVQRIVSTLAGVKGGTSFVTVNSVANANVADVKAFAYQGSLNKTVVAFWFGNHDPRTPPAASTCSLTFTVPHPHPNPYVMNAMTGTLVPLSSYKSSQSGTQITVAGLPISDQPQIIVMLQSQRQCQSHLRRVPPHNFTAAYSFRRRYAKKWSRRAMDVPAPSKYEELSQQAGC